MKRVKCTMKLNKCLKEGKPMENTNMRLERWLCVLAMQAEGLSLDSSNPYKTACANPSTPLTVSGARIGEPLEEHAAASLVCRVSKGDCKIEGENWHPRRPLDHYSKCVLALTLITHTPSHSCTAAYRDLKNARVSSCLPFLGHPLEHCLNFDITEFFNNTLGFFG